MSLWQDLPKALFTASISNVKAELSNSVRLYEVPQGCLPPFQRRGSTQKKEALQLAVYSSWHVYPHLLQCLALLRVPLRFHRDQQGEIGPPRTAGGVRLVQGLADRFPSDPSRVQT